MAVVLCGGKRGQKEGLRIRKTRGSFPWGKFIASE
jgi:hypothetical protein